MGTEGVLLSPSNPIGMAVVVVVVVVANLGPGTLASV